jgi:hypothetical protein
MHLVEDMEDIDDRVLGIIFGGIAIAVFSMSWVYPRYESIHGDEVPSPRPAVVGTSGRALTLDTAVSDSSMRQIRRITDADDPLQLVGRRVELDLKAPDLFNPRGFWVGDNDHHVLVVLPRDTAIGAHIGQAIHLSGTVQAVPSADEQRDWGLDASLREELEGQKVYIRADKITRQ